MERCKCGSFALNISPKTSECDVCFYKNQVEALEARNAELVEGTEGFKGANVVLNKECRRTIKERDGFNKKFYEEYKRREAAEARVAAIVTALEIDRTAVNLEPEQLGLIVAAVVKQAKGE